MFRDSLAASHDVIVPRRDRPKPRSRCNSHSSLFRHIELLNGDGGPHARTREEQGCRPHGLLGKLLVFAALVVCLCLCVYVRNGLLFTRALDVTDDGAGLVVHELDADLGNTTARACKIPPWSAFPCRCHRESFARHIAFPRGKNRL